MDLLSAEIYSKETTVGSDKCLILPPRSRFVAALNIPNWRRIRFGFAVSKTTTDNPNEGVAGVSEIASGSPEDWGGFGVFNLPDSASVGSGVYGYNMGTDPQYAQLNGGRRLQAKGSNRGCANITADGVNREGVSSLYRLSIGPSGNTDYQTTDFAAMHAISLDRDGTKTYFYNRSMHVTGDVSLVALTAHLANMTGSMSDYGTVAYHEEATPYLIFQWPFRNSRLRIHAWRVEVLETLEDGG